MTDIQTSNFGSTVMGERHKNSQCKPSDMTNWVAAWDCEIGYAYTSPSSSRSSHILQNSVFYMNDMYLFHNSKD